MRISAQVTTGRGAPSVVLTTGAASHSLAIAAKPEGKGVLTNGGELLFLAAAVCYCNDVYREASRRGVVVDAVEVIVAGEFEGVGAAASGVAYSVKIKGPGDSSVLRSLAEYTDRVAEVHRSLRMSVPIVLAEVQTQTSEPRSP